MIPKIIHLCWLSGDEFPPLIKKCIDSWHEILPDYEIWVWDTKRFDVNSVLWTKQAHETKKYAFAADYIRLYALYNFGGIYLDSDVLVYKSFDDLLSFPYFIGQELRGSFEPAIIGSEKGENWIRDILRHYDNRPFIKSDGSYDEETLPLIFYKSLAPKYKFIQLHGIHKYIDDDKRIYVFDKDFFHSRNFVQAVMTKKSYCSHNFAASWKKGQTTMLERIKKMLPKQIWQFYLFVAHYTFHHKVDTRYRPEFETILK